MTATQLLQHFLAISPWVDRDGTVDKIRYGNPGVEITKIGVGFSACDGNLLRAGQDGCNLFISHEVPFAYVANTPKLLELPWAKRKTDILDRYGITAMNLHDTWDHFPEFGIRDAFAEFLGLGELMMELDYVHPWLEAATTGKNSLGIYAIQPTALHAVCADMLGRFKAIGGHGVKYHGDRNALIRSVAIGVGCHIPSFEALEKGADLLVMVYDRAMEVGLRIQLAESGANILVIEHSFAEIPAMRKMALYLRTRLNLHATFYNEEPKYTYIVAR